MEALHAKRNESKPVSIALILGWFGGPRGELFLRKLDKQITGHFGGGSLGVLVVF